MSRERKLRYTLRTWKQIRLGWDGLQGEYLSSTLWTRGYSVGNWPLLRIPALAALVTPFTSVSVNVLHWIFIQPIQGEIAIVFIPLQQAPSFQKTGNPLADGVQYFGKLLYCRGLIVMERPIT